MEQNIDVLLAFFAGFLSFFSPCTLVLLPVYLGYLSGEKVEEPPIKKRPLLKNFLNTAFFVLGLTLTYTLLGFIVSTMGAKLFVKFKYLFLKLVGLLIAFFGLSLTPLTKIIIPSISLIKIPTAKLLKPNYLTSFAIGSALALSWSPCSGPILSSILLLASSTASVNRGTTLLGFFSAGLAIPLLFTGFLTSSAVEFFKSKIKYFKLINILLSILLIILGFLLFTNKLPLITSKFLSTSIKT